jgi:hypothetical protein
MVIFHSYVKLPEGTSTILCPYEDVCRAIKLSHSQAVPLRILGRESNHQKDRKVILFYSLVDI